MSLGVWVGRISGVNVAVGTKVSVGIGVSLGKGVPVGAGEEVCVTGMNGSEFRGVGV